MALPSRTDCAPWASARLALAERLCRKTDRIDPTRVRRPCDRLGRGAPTPDSAGLCPLLQRAENAPLVGQRGAILAPGAADRKHHVTATPRRIASPLHASLSFRYTQAAPPSGVTNSRRLVPSFRDIMRAADAQENKMAPVPNKLRDPNPSGAKMLARVLVVIGVSRLG